MSIRHMATLVAIADKGSFVEAAEAMFITQSAVSMQMKALEEELSMQLFDRSKRPPVLNDAGLAIVPRARELVTMYQRLMKDPVPLGDVSGHLRLGSIHTVLTTLLPRALVAMRENFPRLHVSVRSSLSSELMTLVDRGVMDVALISEPRYMAPSLVWTPISIESLIIIAPMDAPNDLPETLLQTMPFIRFSRSAWVGQLIEDYFREHGIQVDEVMELNTLEAVSTMVYHGLGVSVVPYSEVAHPGALPLKRLSFTNPAPKRVLGVIQRQDTQKQMLIDALCDELTKNLSGPHPPARRTRST